MCFLVPSAHVLSTLLWEIPLVFQFVTIVNRYARLRILDAQNVILTCGVTMRATLLHPVLACSLAMATPRTASAKTKRPLQEEGALEARKTQKTEGSEAEDGSDDDDPDDEAEEDHAGNGDDDQAGNGDEVEDDADEEAGEIKVCHFNAILLLCVSCDCQ